MTRISKPVWVLLIMAALFFLYLPSLSQYLHLRHQEEKLIREIKDLKGEIQDLKREEYLMRNDLQHLEKVIRKELGLAKPGEVIYKLVPERAPASEEVSRGEGEKPKVIRM